MDQHIKRLRAKLEEFPHEGWEIETLWGVGYKIAEKPEGAAGGDSKAKQKDVAR